MFICFFFVSSCQQEITLEEASWTNEQVEILKKAEQAGVHHNLALDYLASNCDLATVSDEQKFEIIMDYFIAISKSDAEKAALLDAKERKCSSCNFNYTSISEWVEAKKTLLKSKETMYALKIENALSLYHGSGVERVVEELKRIEREMVIDIDLADSPILTSSAILRHSLFYWDSAYSNPNHPYYSEVNRDVSFRICTWCIHVALVDAFSYSDCLANGMFGTYEVAQTVCTGQATYVSALYY